MAYGSAGGFGFKAVGSILNADFTQTVHPYSIDPTYETSIGIGDLVVMARQSNGTPAIPNGSGGYIRKYNVANVDTALPLGIFVGCEFKPAKIMQPSSNGAWIAGTAVSSGIVTAYINDDPNLILEVVSSNTDGSGATPLELGMLWKNAKPSTVTNIDTLSGISNVTLDLETVNTTATLPFQIIGLGGNPRNQLGQDYNVVRVRFNRHLFGKVGTAGLA